jgi:hypothetical protein
MILGWTAELCAIAALTLLAGVGVAAVLARQGGAADWSKWSNVGQTFGALSSIISGLALAAVVMTARLQFQEMRSHRSELEQQGRSLRSNHSELQRTAAANLGMLQLEILRMSIDDPGLAQVWPPFVPGLPRELNRQYLYANIIYQFHWTSLHVGNHSDEQVIASLRYLFTSPLMRGYWRAAEFARTSLKPGTPEYDFALRVDEVCREYEAVVASAPHPQQTSPTQLHDPREAEAAA